MGFLAELVSAVCFGAVLLTWSSASAPAPDLVPQSSASETPPAPEAPSDDCDCEGMQSTIDRQWARIDRLQCDNAAWEYKAMEFDDKIAKLQSAPRIAQFCKRCDFRQHRVPFCDRCGDLSRRLAASERRCESLSRANDILRSENSEYNRFFGMHSAQLKEQEHRVWAARFLGPNQQEFIQPAIQHPNQNPMPSVLQFPAKQPQRLLEIRQPTVAAPSVQFFSAYPQMPANPVQNASGIQPPPITVAPPQATPVVPIPAGTPSKVPEIKSAPKAAEPSQPASAPPKLPTPQPPPPKSPKTPSVAQKTLPDFNPDKIEIKFPKKGAKVPTKLVINPPGTKSATAHKATPPSSSSAPAIPHASGSAARPAASYGIGGSGKPSAGKAMMDRLVRLGLSYKG